MNNQKNGPFEKFANFIMEHEENYDSSPQSIQKLKETVSAQMLRAQNASKKTWLAGARQRRKTFESSAKNLHEELSKKYGDRASLVNAIKSGSFGADAAKRMHLEFRNLDPNAISEDDLVSILGDEKIIELLAEFKKKEKK